MHAPHRPESRRLLEKLIRDILRAETQAIDHPVREAKRIGDAPPVVALQEVATHAAAMRARFLRVLATNEISLPTGTLGATLATLRHLVVDRVVDPERSFRTVLYDLRHGVDIVKLLRVVTRNIGLFGVIRWCDDWLGARRTLVACVEAQLAWFAEREVRATVAIVEGEDLEDLADDCDVETTAPVPDAPPSSPSEWHTDRNT